VLVRQIAAGEVVERPASVVKELIENSIDAAARRIVLAIEDGGRQLIRVTDDGTGMWPEELRLAVAPHATSKITSESDLHAIATLGFRGEALGSISSVSKMRIVSRPAAAEEAHEIRVSGERLEASRAAGAPQGTTVEVRDLFFNVPARRKFLRAASTEVGHVNEQFARLALAHPNVGFEQSNNGRAVQSLPAGQKRQERIGRLFGSELADALLHVERSERGVTLEAFAAPPSRSRATAQWQYVFVNGRCIRDRFLQHALKEAYRGLMEPDRHGVVFLFLTVDPRDLDVNVHPTKQEVRWTDGNLIHSQVLSALRETFQRHDLRPNLRTSRFDSAPSDLEQDRVRADFAALMKSAAPTLGRPNGTSPASSFGPAGGSPSAWQQLYGRETPAAQPAPTAPPTAVASEEPSRTLRAIQMHDLYLVVEEEDGIVIIDQHALHERVMYETLKARFLQGSLESQRLLLPETLRIGAPQMALLETHAELLRRLGLEVTPFGSDTVAVHAFPTVLKDTQAVGFLGDLLDQLAQWDAAEDPENVIHRVLDMAACKAAVKAGDRLSAAEIETLVAQRHLIDKAASCPHGRPTTLRLTKSDLNRQFKRT
jgi:DNA mismatch repair protein MutL